MRVIKNQNGFTLIEVLVALIIVAMASAFLIIGYNQLVQRQASSRIEEVQAWLEAAADISVLQSTVLGVTHIEDQLRLLVFFHGDWFLLADHEPLAIDEEIQITWPETRLEESLPSTVDPDHPQPYLVLTPGGEIFPEGRIELSMGEQRAQISWQETTKFVLTWQES
jgi:prepilin-type N-terminal cleavage/methylation domain-containing protein